MTDAFRQLVALKNMGMIRFDSDFTILEVNAAAGRILNETVSSIQGGRLQSFFPEIVGSEDLIRNVLTGDETDYSLDFVNRENGAGQVVYLDLYILADSPDRGVLVLEDTTESARIKQKLNQQKFELLLYKRNPAFHQQFLDGSILGKAPPIQDIRKIIYKISRVPNATVLLLGESGTGKNLAARVIHYTSMPADAPFVDINCAAIPENLIESELFGYVKGAFTHATGSRAGLLEEARGGTVFLDEIGDLPLNMQAKLLTVLETKKFRRLGNNRPVELKARIITATNQDLEQRVAEKLFRNDLYYRLNVVSLTMPPLRTLGQDVLLIAEHLIKVFNVELNKRVKGLTPDAERALTDYRWPGNVRELSNCIERAMIFAEGHRIHSSELILPEEKTGSRNDPWTLPAEGLNLEDVERRLILSALEKSGGNKSKAARLLGLTRDTFRYRLEKFSLK